MDLYKDFRKCIIKVDIEGAEMDLFENDHNSLDKFGVIIIELHERILPGIEKSFMKFNHNYKRLFFKTDHEKFISIKNGFSIDY